MKTTTACRLEDVDYLDELLPCDFNARCERLMLRIGPAPSPTSSCGCGPPRRRLRAVVPVVQVPANCAPSFPWSKSLPVAVEAQRKGERASESLSAVRACSAAVRACLLLCMLPCVLVPSCAAGQEELPCLLRCRTCVLMLASRVCVVRCVLLPAGHVRVRARARRPSRCAGAAAGQPQRGDGFAALVPCSWSPSQPTALRLP